MTTITIMKSKTGEYREVTCAGHAGYAQAGSDIICSAISILVINTINSLEQLTETDSVVTVEEESGKIYLKLNRVDEKGTLLLDAMVLGLQNVVAEYGKRYLKLIIKEV